MLNTLSLAAEDAGTQSTLRATAYNFGSIDLSARTAELSHACMMICGFCGEQIQWESIPIPIV